MSLDEVIKKINKEAGSEIVGYGIPKKDYTRIPFTSPRMNYCTYGGIPTGRLVEFYGEEHGVKTSSALDIVSNYQRMQANEEIPKKHKILKLTQEEIENVNRIRTSKQIDLVI